MSVSRDSLRRGAVPLHGGKRNFSSKCLGRSATACPVVYLSRAVVILLAARYACLWWSPRRTGLPPVVPSLELTPVWFSSPVSRGSADGSLSWRLLEASSTSVCVTSGTPGGLCRQGQAAQRLSPIFAELPAIWSVGSFLPRAPYLQEAFSLDYFSRPSLPL